jgi:hypothetical protein
MTSPTLRGNFWWSLARVAPAKEADPETRITTRERLSSHEQSEIHRTVCRMTPGEHGLLVSIKRPQRREVVVRI